MRFYPDKTKMTCVMCDFRCLACNSGSNTDCTVCDNSIEGVIKSPDGNGCECIKGRSPNFLLKRCESKNRINLRESRFIDEKNFFLPGKIN